VTLVGKGVCFDSGGLDLKPSTGMLIMKKDMGGAANVLALAQMVMDARLKLRLRVLIPAVENAVAGNAFRPLDIFTSRKGLTVGNRQYRRRGPFDTGGCAGAGG
jgi:leucyl aminopeptidase